MEMSILQEVADLLRRAQRVAVLTGAGVSAESGVPTFRQAQTGLWAQYDPQELATPEAFRRNPRLVWEWYAWRRQLVSQAEPNPGHFALVEMARRVPRLTLITQNVDGLHQRAGSQDAIELHGNLQRVKCYDRAHAVTTWDETAEIPPRCPICGSLLRPDVVWFGENLPLAALDAAFASARECDLFFSIGTSALVHPAASIPLEALRAHAPVVEINPERTPLTHYVTHFLMGPSGQLLPQLVQLAWGQRP